MRANTLFAAAAAILAISFAFADEPDPGGNPNPGGGFDVTIPPGDYIVHLPDNTWTPEPPPEGDPGWLMWEGIIDAFSGAWGALMAEIEKVKCPAGHANCGSGGSSVTLNAVTSVKMSGGTLEIGYQKQGFSNGLASGSPSAGVVKGDILNGDTTSIDLLHAQNVTLSGTGRLSFNADTYSFSNGLLQKQPSSYTREVDFKKIAATGNLKDADNYETCYNEAKGDWMATILSYHNGEATETVISNFHPVAFTGNYNQLTNTPTFRLVKQGDGEGEGGGITLALTTEASSNDTDNVTLAAIAGSGSWGDLQGFPDGGIDYVNDFYMDGNTVMAKVFHATITTNGLDYGEENSYRVVEVCTLPDPCSCSTNTPSGGGGGGTNTYTYVCDCIIKTPEDETDPIWGREKKDYEKKTDHEKDIEDLFDQIGGLSDRISSLENWREFLDELLDVPPLDIGGGNDPPPSTPPGTSIASN